MSNVVTTDCPRCSQRLRIAPERVPKAGHTIGLVCPRCRERWQWSAAGRAAAIRELGFQCAHSGDRFAVLYAKENRDSKFRVRAIEKTGQVIKRLLSSGTSRSPRSHSAEPVANASWAATEFDHAGWRCPHCRDRGVFTNAFLKCSGCNGLRCGARIIQIHGGGRTFRCPCGAHAEVLDGGAPCASFEGKMTDVAFHPRVGEKQALSGRRDEPRLKRSSRSPWGSLSRRRLPG